MGTKSSSLRSRQNIQRRPNIQRNIENRNINSNQDDEIMEQYNQILQRHQLIDALKKSKKQHTFFLKKYHIIKLENSDLLLQNECPICLENLLVGDSVYLTPCCHYFHKNCLKDWILIENICPSCRMKLGNNTAAEIDMCLFTRQEKVEKAKKRYLSSLDLDKLQQLLSSNNIDKIELDKEKMISKLMKFNNFYQDEVVIDEGLTESDSSESNFSESNSSESNSEASSESSSSSWYSNESNTSSSNSNSNESVKIRYLNRKS